MSNHLNDKEIDLYISGLASDNDVIKAEEHFKSCPVCRNAVDTISYIIAPQSADGVPGEHVRQNIVAEWYKLHNENAEKEKFSKKRISRFITGFAVAASVIAALSAYIFFGITEVPEINNLLVSSLNGDVYLNDSAAVVNTQLIKGSVIRTGTVSDVSLSADGYILNIGPSSILEISENSIKTGFSFKLREGRILSRSSGPILYSFECGSYRVTPAGTEFMLNFSGGKLDAVVSQGIILLTGFDLRVEIAAGEKWSSEYPGIVEPVNPDKKAISSADAASTDSAAEKSELKSGITGKSEDHKTEIKIDPGYSDSNQIDEKKERLERIKSERELRDQMNDIKKEQKQERKGRNKG